MFRTWNESHVVAASTVSLSKSWPALAAAVLGATILFGAALANSNTVHNAAHDTRHATAFPCH